MSLVANLKEEELIRANEIPVQLPKIDLVWPDEYKKLPKEVKDDYIFDEKRNCYMVPDYIWAEKWRQHGPYYRDEKHPNYIKWAIGGSTLPELYDGSALSNILYLYKGQHGSPYKSAIEEYAEKAGFDMLPVQKGDDSVFFVGHNEEQSIRDMFVRLYSNDHPEDTIEVINDTHMYQCGRKNDNGTLKHPYCLIDPDGIVVINGKRGVLECKTCNFKSEDYKLWKSGKVPLKYYLQVCWYMACLNVSYAYIVCKMGMSESDYTYIFIQRDLEIEEEIFKMADDFVKCLEAGVEPDTSGQDTSLIYRYYLRRMGEVNADAEPEEISADKKDVAIKLSAINNLIEAKQKEIDDLKKQREMLLVNEILPELKSYEAPYVSIPNGPSDEIQIKFRKKPTFTIDEERLKKERPDIYKTYVENVEKFNTTLFKKEQPDVAKLYRKVQHVTDAYMNYCEVKFAQKK